MNIEDELRGALDVPAPPPTTTLDDVLKRGRRRVFAQRAGALLGVVVTVAGIGVAAATLNVAAPPTPADGPPDLPATVVHGLGWPRVSAPPQQPYDTWKPAASAPPPAGHPVLELPKCDPPEPKLRLMTPVGLVPLSEDFVAKWLATVREQLPEMQVGELRKGTLVHEYEVDLTDRGGTGSLQLRAGRFSGTPQQFADDDMWSTGNCEPPYRQMLPDGTIMQLHSMYPAEPFQSLTQVMTVFRPDGTLFRLRLQNWSSKDIRPDPKQPEMWERFGPGRANLPLTEEQFGRLGPAVAEVA